MANDQIVPEPEGHSEALQRQGMVIDRKTADMLQALVEVAGLELILITIRTNHHADPHDVSVAATNYRNAVTRLEVAQQSLINEHQRAMRMMSDATSA